MKKHHISALVISAVALAMAAIAGKTFLEHRIVEPIVRGPGVTDIRKLSAWYPDLAGIISPTTIGVLAAAKAIEDEGKKGKVQLTGLGLPSEMKQYILNGTCGQMALWNPIDLGYTSTYILEALVTGKATGKAGETMKAGRMGNLTIGADGLMVMGTPFVFNASNIAKFAEMF